MANKLAILGGGESGTGAAILAKKKGYEVWLSDAGIINEKYKNVLLYHEVAFEEGKHSLNKILSAKEVVKSPGIPENIEVVKKIAQNDIPVISEIEFAGRYTNAKKICITGSNGKTTTSLLTYHILSKAGFNVGVAGNVGKSFAWQVAENEFDYYVLEISSFQLDGMTDFKADISVLLNITPDHLERYDNSFNRYVDSKMRIIQNQTENDCFIYNMDDPAINSWILKNKIAPKIYPFSANTVIREGAFINENKELTIIIKNELLKLDIMEMTIQGMHNAYNSMASGIAARLVDVRKDFVKESFCDFKNIEHRLESVGFVKGIEFINDSKATNINSAWYALETMTKPVIWIAGGQEKSNDYSELEGLVKEKVKAIVCLGIDNSNIKNTFQKLVGEFYETATAKEAVKTAYKLAKPGDVILLSPACASFDLFQNFEDRGQKFKQAVFDL